jgi:GT2 family glycosyltransferase
VFRPVKFRLVSPGTGPVECDTMNGNCVLIPRVVASSVGNLDENFAHAMGDLDYGLRAREKGFSIVVIPRIVGTCAGNDGSKIATGAKIGVRKRLAQVTGPKNLPLGSWRVFTRRHGGPFWFAYWLWPYMKTVLVTVFSRA